MPHVEREGIKVYYESFGQGTPIVFLHPIATNRYIWAHQLFAFAPHHRIIAVDHRGHGQSDRPSQGYAIKEMAADLVAILDDAKVEKAVLVANSIGGMIAMQTNLDAPDRVIANLLLSTGTNLLRRRTPGPDQGLPADWDELLDGMIERTTSARTKRERPEVREYLSGAGRVKGGSSLAVFLANARDPNGVFLWNIEDRLKDIARPALVIAGDEDRAVPAEATRRLAEGIPGARFKLVAEVGHYYQLERPADFNEDLRAFLKEVGV